MAEPARQTNLALARNKMNSVFSFADYRDKRWEGDGAIGMRPFIAQHNLKWWVVTSPSYDPSVSEYWDTDDEGVHGDFNSSAQVNFWSDLTAEAIAATLLNIIETDNTRYVFVRGEGAAPSVDLFGE